MYAHDHPGAAQGHPGVIVTLVPEIRARKGVNVRAGVGCRRD